MPTYIVHIYREMRLSFTGIEADTPEQAADLARDRPTDEADNVDDCEGETLCALVDLEGDSEYEHSLLVDFELERERKAARTLLAACRMVVDRWEHGDLAEAARTCQAAIAEAEIAGIRSEPSEPGLLALLEAVLPYAENEGQSLYACWKRDGDDAARQAADACERAIEQARITITIATAKAASSRACTTRT